MVIRKIKQRVYYSVAEKKKIVAAVNKNPSKLLAIANKYNLNYATIQHWRTYGVRPEGEKTYMNDAQKNKILDEVGKGIPVKEITKKYNISQASVRRWANKFKRHEVLGMRKEYNLEEKDKNLYYYILEVKKLMKKLNDLNVKYKI